MAFRSLEVPKHERQRERVRISCKRYDGKEESDFRLLNSLQAPNTISLTSEQHFFMLYQVPNSTLYMDGISAESGGGISSSPIAADQIPVSSALVPKESGGVVQGNAAERSVVQAPTGLGEVLQKVATNPHQALVTMSQAVVPAGERSVMQQKPGHGAAHVPVLPDSKEPRKQDIAQVEEQQPDLSLKQFDSLLARIRDTGNETVQRSILRAMLKVLKSFLQITSLAVSAEQLGSQAQGISSIPTDMLDILGTARPSEREALVGKIERFAGRNKDGMQVIPAAPVQGIVSVKEVKQDKPDHEKPYMPSADQHSDASEASYREVSKPALNPAKPIPDVHPAANPPTLGNPVLNRPAIAPPRIRDSIPNMAAPKVSVSASPAKLAPAA